MEEEQLLILILWGKVVMNKKGMTLMELLVSLAMLSVSLVFVYSLIVNLQHKKTVSDNYTDNLIKIAEIENKIQYELFGVINYGEKKVQAVNITSTDSSLKVTLEKDGVIHTKNIALEKNSNGLEILIKDSSNNIIRKWKLDNVSDFKVKENYLKTNDSKAINYQYTIYLYDQFENVSDSIIIPGYLITKDSTPIVSSTVTS